MNPFNFNSGWPSSSAVRERQKEKGKRWHSDGEQHADRNAADGWVIVSVKDALTTKGDVPHADDTGPAMGN